jgi:hypothetical protein
MHGGPRPGTTGLRQNWARWRRHSAVARQLEGVVCRRCRRLSRHRLCHGAARHCRRRRLYGQIRLVQPSHVPRLSASGRRESWNLRRGRRHVTSYRRHRRADDARLRRLERLGRPWRRRRRTRYWRSRWRLACYRSRPRGCAFCSRQQGRRTCGRLGLRGRCRQANGHIGIWPRRPSDNLRVRRRTRVSRMAFGRPGHRHRARHHWRCR